MSTNADTNLLLFYCYWLVIEVLAINITIALIADNEYSARIYTREYRHIYEDWFIT